MDRWIRREERECERMNMFSERERERELCLLRGCDQRKGHSNKRVVSIAGVTASKATAARIISREFKRLPLVTSLCFSIEIAAVKIRRIKHCDLYDLKLIINLLIRDKRSCY